VSLVSVLQLVLLTDIRHYRLLNERLAMQPLLGIATDTVQSQARCFFF
jgi:hypothetical protein